MSGAGKLFATNNKESVILFASIDGKMPGNSYLYVSNDFAVSHTAHLQAVCLVVKAWLCSEEDSGNMIFFCTLTFLNHHCLS